MPKRKYPEKLSAFEPITSTTLTHVTTEVAAFYLSRTQWTLRRWSKDGSGPIAPTKFNGRLAWSVADIRQILGV